MNRIVAIILSALIPALNAWSVDYIPKYELISNPAYPSGDLAVATYNVRDYGVDASGKVDCTSKVQALLDAAAGVGSLIDINGDSKKRGWYGNPTGGIVYFPEGTYLFTSSLIIPRGVTLRGDWKEPSAESSASGTIFKIEPRRGAGTEIESSSFIIMQPTTEVNGITFWYPQQKPSNITKYPPTILYGEQGYWGNDYCTVKRCTFLNSYTAIKFSSFNGGGCPNIFGIYGTPLYQGVVMDCIADVGRFDGIHFSPAYWESCGLDNAPSAGEIDSWLYENATGFVMRRNDWSYTCNFTVNGYNIGFHAQSSPEGVASSGNPNGHNYAFDLRNCKTGIKISGASNSSIMFTNVSTPGCEVGFDMPVSVLGPVQLYGCNIYGTQKAVSLGENSSPGVQIQACNIEGDTDIFNGQLSSINSSYTGNVHIGPKARTIFVGNKFVGKGSIHNESLFECKIDSKEIDIRQLPEFKNEWMRQKTTRPNRDALYVVTDTRFGAEPVSIFADLKSAKDNTGAIQSALDLAKNEGGGVVYMPSGHYRVDGKLTIPTGVELKGSGDLMTVPKGNGAVLESTWGEGNENAYPFISMEKGSGIRGITINYPNQTTPINVKPYPYSIKGNADVYICNVALRASYRGVDLFTNKCDNHYVDYLAGHAFLNVIRVGNGCENGTISNIQCNTIAYACGDETKFGAWPNCDLMKDDSMQAKAYGQNSETLDFMIIGDCTNEILYNNFLFGCHQGMVFCNDGNGGPQNLHSLGNAVDGAVETFVFNGGEHDIDLINSQVVALNHDKEIEYINFGRLSATFVKTGRDFHKTATFFSGNYWGGGDRLIKADGGTVNLYSSNLATSGSVETMSIRNDAKVNFVNVNRRTGNKLFETPGSQESNCGVYASILNCNNAIENRFAKWENNLPISWDFASYDNLLPRAGWKATAFNDASGSGIARYAIDGNASTRWTTETAQASGQWFAIDFGKDEKFNTLILDSSASPNDGPKAYTVEIFEADGTWKEVTSGEKGSSTMIVTFPDVETSKIRITQTENTTGGYWSIHEAYIAQLASSAIEDVVDDLYSVFFREDSIHLNMCDESVTISIYDLNGRLVDMANNFGHDYSLSHISQGVYIIEVAGKQFGRKVMKIKK